MIKEALNLGWNFKTIATMVARQSTKVDNSGSVEFYSERCSCIQLGENIK
jgi:hypothetical protein